jgi:hypothetical protein
MMVVAIMVIIPFMASVPVSVPVLFFVPVMVVGGMSTVVAEMALQGPPVQSVLMSVLMMVVIVVTGSGMQRTVVTVICQADADVAVFSLCRACRSQPHCADQQGRTDESADFHGTAPFRLSQ